MACVELTLAIKYPKKPVPELSVGAAYYGMKDFATKDASQPVRAKSPGYTRFKDAVSVLQNIGYHFAASWDDRLTVAPPTAKMPRGTKLAEVCYHSFPLADNDQSFPPTHSKRPAVSIAQSIYQELSHNRPVGAGFPAYVRPGAHGMTNWTAAFEHGSVLMPRPGDALDMEAGHAVCIVGFTGRGEIISAVQDGFFIFRNSFGEMFASAPTTGWPQGYGLLPAILVDQTCWEVMFMRKASPGDPKGEEKRQNRT
jgi:hypothetical protein